MRCLILVGILFGCSLSVLHGDTTQWNRHAYIVKVLARNQTVRQSRSCSGILVSPSLVLTAPQCVQEGKIRMDEIVVGILRSGNRVSKRAGTLLAVTETKALIQIAPLPIKELCPTGVAPQRVARLPMKPSLTHSAVIDNAEDLVAKCRVTGFITLEKNSGFLKWDRMVQFDTEEFPPIRGNRVIVPVQGNHTTCFEDAGIPLECTMDDEEQSYIQVAMLTLLEVPKGGKSCRDAISMHFTPLWDEQTMELLEKHDFPGVIQVREACGSDSLMDNL